MLPDKTFVSQVTKDVSLLPNLRSAGKMLQNVAVANGAGRYHGGTNPGRTSCLLPENSEIELHHESRSLQDSV